ncbi:MAG: HAMP domain-containing histidine kinase [Defluviitaleaceae bacterium]|nr:HAMP domain-containing histidine kinase [Defluviitaleaceae bacterium]
MMIFLVIACVLLGTGFAIMLAKWLLLKRDLREIGRLSTHILQTDTNAQLTTTTFDKDITALSQSINNLLQKSRQDYFDVQRTQAILKQAITNISHDLRTPLTSAKGYLQMFENKDIDNETRLRYLTTIRERLDALTLLMDSLFAFSRAVEGDVVLRRVNVSNILRDTLVGNYVDIEKKGMTVDNNIPDTPLYAICDEDAIKRVLTNLIANAATHGRDYLRVTLSDGVIEIANKTDDLHNIVINNIFERFYTADTSRSNKRTGLGLAIAKELLEKMNATISVEKKGEFFVTKIKLKIA